MPATLFKKDSGTGVFSCKFCEISKKTFSTEHLWTTDSGYRHSNDFYWVLFIYFVFTNLLNTNTNMEARNLGYSMKNIPIPPRQGYLKNMMEKVENFISKLR